MTFKYKYTGRGTITFFRDGKEYTVSAEDSRLPKEIEFDKEIERPERFGLALIEESKKKTDKKLKENE